MDSDSTTQLTIILVLLILSAFFSSTETAFTKLNSVRLIALKEEGNKRAGLALKILDKYGKMLSAILIGNNVVNLVASALATTVAIKININVGVATFILTVLVLLFCEIVPKTISSLKAEKIALGFAPVISVYMTVLTPLVFITDGLAKLVIKCFKIDDNSHDAMTEEELRTYVDVSHEDGVIEQEEKKMIINVFEFGDSVAKDIMIPKIDMVCVSEDATLDETMAIFREHMYTRLPVYEGTTDEIVGVLNIKDIIREEKPEEFSVRKLMREPFFTYEFKHTADLLNEMRKTSDAIAFVLSEYGECEGMITMEDLLEEIVGEIRDEYDEDEENLIQKMEENTYLIEGSMKLNDINDELGTNLKSEDYDSVGGLLIQLLDDRVPEDGEMVKTEDGITLKVSGMEHNRIRKVILTLPEETEEEE